MLPSGGLLALDWGQKKIGYATVDELGLAVTPRGTLLRKSISKTEAWILSSHDRTLLAQLINDYEPGALVLGLPKNTRGEESDAALGARALAETLKHEFQMEVHLVNEVLTSWNARDAKDEDAAAAATLLQDFLLEKQRIQNKSGFIKGALLVVMLFTVIFLGAAIKFYYDFSAKPLSSLGGELIVDVSPQSTFASVRSSLAEQGLPIDRFAFRAWAWKTGAHKKLRVGEYKIQKNWSAMRVLNELVSGQGLQHKIIVKEGHNIYDIAQSMKNTELKRSTVVDTHDEFFKLTRDAQLLERMEVPRGSAQVTLEGYLFPETYNYQKYDTPRKLIEAMLNQFEKRALPILKQHPWGQTKEGRYRLLTLASIVEKESGLAAEQPIIASAFWNRLAKKMKLQSDPTTIYGLLPHFDGNLKRVHLTSPSDYNTYTLPELPIGPIANPGESALKAVINPAITKYYYFVGKGDGTHAFSEDLSTHNAYVRRYQLGIIDDGKSKNQK